MKAPADPQCIDWLRSPPALKVLHEIVSEFMFEGVPVHRRLELLFSELQVTRRRSLPNRSDSS